MESVEADAESLWFAVRACCRFVSTIEMIDWAVERMLEGRDGPAVVELACLDSVDSRYEDTIPIFRRALAEEGIDLADRDAALKAYFRVLMRDISAGKLDPTLGTERVWNRITAVGLYHAPYAGFHRWYDECLREWDFLHSGIRADGSDIPEEELPKMIREKAQRELASTDTS